MTKSPVYDKMFKNHTHGGIIMICLNCQNEMRIGTEQVATGQDGLPIFHRFGYCDKCMIKQDIDLTLQMQMANEYYGSQQEDFCKHEESLLGIFSFIFSLMVFLFITHQIRFVLCLISIALGMASICQNKKRKIFGSIGFAISASIIGIIEFLKFLLPLFGFNF